MEGKINIFGDADVMFAVYKDGSYADTIPGKSDGYSFQKAECTNGATAKWDYSEWGVKVTSLNKTKTKCSLYFVKSGTDTSVSGKINDLLNDSIVGASLAVDDSNNIRFIGKNPNNWVTFNNEKWRIIGLMDNIETSTGIKEKLLKIIRSDSLGDHSWDKPDSGVNAGYGVNEWSRADLMYALKKYGGESDSECKDTSCNSWSQLSLSAQNMIETVVWNTGTSNTSGWGNHNFPIQQYLWEQSTNTGKQCSSNGCDDTVDRTTKWTGKVGLMYPSDYGYATDGEGNLMYRDQCLYTPFSNWSKSSYCYLNDWLRDSSKDQWTMTPAPYFSSASYVFYVNTSGYVDCYKVNNTFAVRPVVYLKSSVKITGGTGEEKSPFLLKLG